MHITQENTTNIRIGRDTKKDFDALGSYGENANDILIKLLKCWKERYGTSERDEQ